MPWALQFTKTIQHLPYILKDLWLEVFVYCKEIIEEDEMVRIEPDRFSRLPLDKKHFIYEDVIDTLIGIQTTPKNTWLDMAALTPFLFLPDQIDNIRWQDDIMQLYWTFRVIQVHTNLHLLISKNTTVLQKYFIKMSSSIGKYSRRDFILLTKILDYPTNINTVKIFKRFALECLEDLQNYIFSENIQTYNTINDTNRNDPYFKNYISKHRARCRDYIQGGQGKFLLEKARQEHLIIKNHIRLNSINSILCKLGKQNALSKISKGCENWIWKPICKDNNYGIVCKLAKKYFPDD